MQFQENLKYYREKAGYKTAKDFSKALKISYTTYFAYENQGREPKYEILCKIANLLNVSLDDLLGRTPTDEDERLKKTIEDVLSISDIKYLKLIDINSEYVSFDLCGNDEQAIECTSFKKKEILLKIEQIRREVQKKEKLLLYGWLSNAGIEKAIKKLEKNTGEIKTFNRLYKLSDFEKLQNANSNLINIYELQNLKLIINRYIGQVPIYASNN